MAAGSVVEMTVSTFQAAVRTTAQLAGHGGSAVGCPSFSYLGIQGSTIRAGALDSQPTNRLDTNFIYLQTSSHMLASGVAVNRILSHRKTATTDF
jgi:hypothetical protein